METNNLHQQAVDMMTWGLLQELNFKNILDKVNVDQVHNVIYRFLKKKITDKELSVTDIEEISNNIRAKAKVLFNKIGGEWGRSDDGCHDIATAAVAFGKQNYAKCLKDYDYLVSMREATKEYENVLYPFNDVVEENKKQNDFINESLAVSDEVKNETIKLAKQIRDDAFLNITKQKNDAIGIYVENSFNINIFGFTYFVFYQYYTYIKNKNMLDKLKCKANISKKIITLSVFDKPEYFENHISHELLHVFQYSKNFHNYYNSKNKESDLYKIAQNILSHQNNFNQIEIDFTNALYITYSFEQDAMVHGLFNSLSDNSEIANSLVFETEEYEYLKDIKKSIEKIDKFNETLFNNLITKNAFLIRLQKAYKRYKTKIEKVVQKVNDEYLENNEGIYINPPTHESIKYLKNKINEEQTLWFKKIK